MLDTLARIIAVPMTFFYEIIPNYGLAIIFLTLVVNVLMFPLTLKQTRSTRAMTSIQPEVKKLQKLYKDDKETLQKEMMALYKEKGVNPAGCLFPMLIQMPIWFGLFRLLRNPLNTATDGSETISFIPKDSSLYQALSNTAHQRFLGMDLSRSPSEIVGADTGFDLGAALPYLLAVLIVLGTAYVQQWQTTRGQTPDTDQARQMQMVTKIMPLMFGFFAYSFPAGLNLYFITANVFRIGQQALIFKIDGRPTPIPREPEPDPEAPPPKPVSQPVSEKKRKRRRRK
ncbi:MAG: YidC/Oxa1 family membrane protein insertase [Acidimicrobiia bacterium]